MRNKWLLFIGILTFSTFLYACSDDKTEVLPPDPKPDSGEEEKGDNNGIVEEKDIQIKVVSATGTNYGNLISDEDMLLTYDGDKETCLIKGGKGAVTLTYEFGEEGKIIDYAIYYPYNTSGWYGSWGSADISILEAGKNEFEMIYPNKTFSGSKMPTNIPFDGHKKIKAIRFHPLKGDANNPAWNSCAEIEFFCQENPAFDLLTLFKDNTCSELKDGITETDIKNCTNSFYRNIAQAMYNNTYERAFRIQEFRAYPDPIVQAKENLMNRFSIRDMTGIYVSKGDTLTLFLGNTHGESVTLLIKDNTNGEESQYLLKRAGLNQIEATNQGLVYVKYFSNHYETIDPVKIHFATGKVNGYFDTTKHTAEQWKDIIQNTTWYFFDMVGTHTQISFSSNDFSQYCTDPFKLMGTYDKMVELGEEFTGLKKYGRELRNKLYITYNNGTGGAMGAADTQINWNNPSNFSIPTAVTSETLWNNMWGVAHELGHELQIRSGRQRYQGMLEVTNNLIPAYVQLQFGCESRLFTSVTNPQKTSFQSEFERAMTYYGANKRPHNYNMKGVRSVLTKLIPLWQIYLYSYEVRGEDWFKDYYEELRKSSNESTQGDAQMELLRILCKVSRLNLLDFFEHTGFLTPVDDMTDNGDKENFKVTQKMIDNLKAEIEAKNYSKPDVQFWRLTDQRDNIEAFKYKKAIVTGSATQQGKTFTMTDWKNVAAYEVYTDGKLVFVSPHHTFTVEGEVNNSTYIHAISATGEVTNVILNK